MIATLRSIESDDFRADYGPKYPLISEVLNTKHPFSFPASVCLALFKKNMQLNMNQNQGRADALFCQIAIISAAWLDSNKQRLITAFHFQIKRVMNSGETLPPEFDLHDGDLCETAPICGFWVQIINLLLLAEFCLFPKSMRTSGTYSHKMKKWYEYENHLGRGDDETKHQLLRTRNGSCTSNGIIRWLWGGEKVVLWREWSSVHLKLRLRAQLP